MLIKFININLKEINILNSYDRKYFDNWNRSENSITPTYIQGPYIISKISFVTSAHCYKCVCVASWVSNINTTKNLTGNDSRQLSDIIMTL